MSALLQLCLVAVFCAAISSADDLHVGNTTNTILVYTENVKLKSIPLRTRTKNVFYNTNIASSTIKGIMAIDLDKSKAQAIITSGGIGWNYVNVRMKSKPGRGLNYRVQIYV